MSAIWNPHQHTVPISTDRLMHRWHFITHCFVVYRACNYYASWLMVTYTCADHKIVNHDQTHQPLTLEIMWERWISTLKGQTEKIKTGRKHFVRLRTFTACFSRECFMQNRIQNPEIFTQLITDICKTGCFIVAILCYLAYLVLFPVTIKIRACGSLTALLKKVFVFRFIHRKLGWRYTKYKITMSKQWFWI